jgi:hypothetical protein
MGIFFPNRDALWEFDESAFGDMYSPANIICESNNCAEPSMNSDKQYEFKLCFYCGSAGIHYNCFTGSNSDKFTCISCKAVINRSKSDQSICLDRSKRKSVQKDSPDIKQPPTNSDDENLPSTSIQQQNVTKKPKSLAATLLGESDCTSSDEDNPTVYTYVKLT